MKYLWASWGRKSNGQVPSVKGSRTKRIAGYGCAVTFSSPGLEWSCPHATYDVSLKVFESSYCHG
ncbi:MAG TPA: hypothetical protein VF490_17655 [Chryseosolibacter sp.]